MTRLVESRRGEVLRPHERIAVVHDAHAPRFADREVGRFGLRLLTRTERASPRVEAREAGRSRGADPASRRREHDRLLGERVDPEFGHGSSESRRAVF